MNTGTGNFMLPESDLQVAGGLGLARTYNSMDDHVAADVQSGKSGLFGDGWTSSWDVLLRPPAIGASQTGLELRLGDGRRVAIPSDGEGGWQVPTHLRAEVVATTHPELGAVRELRFVDGRVWRFDLDGRLLSMADDGPTRISAARSASGFPTAVTVESAEGASWVPGPALAIHDDSGDGLVDRVSDPGGNQVSYGYEDGRLVSASVPHHPSEYPEGAAPTAVSYVHDPAGRIAEVHRRVDDGSDPLVEVVNTFDDFGRVVSQVMPSGEVADFEYGPLDNATGTRTRTVTHRWPDDSGTPDELDAPVRSRRGPPQRRCEQR